MVIVALDVGDARIGVAACDELELLATPRATVHRKTTAAALDALVIEIRRAEAEMLVIGLPISFDGQLHAQARSVQSFAAKLQGRLIEAGIDIPLVYADETLSSVRAEERLREAGVRGPRIRERIDAEAAAVILGDYLAQRHKAAMAANANALSATNEANETSEIDGAHDAQTEPEGN